MKRRLLGYFLALFLPLAAAVGSGAVLLYRAQAAKQLEAIELRETIDTQRGAAVLRANAVDSAQDVRLMQALPSMRAVLEDGSPEAFEHLQRTFVAAATTERGIDRIRWIDETGFERVRVSVVDGNVVPTPPAALQSKSDRYFVHELAALPRGAIYVSPMDYSVDGGVVEIPVKPVIRVGTPLFDQGGRRRGMLLVNYRTSGLLEQFDAATRGASGDTVLLDGAGRLLHGTSVHGTVEAPPDAEPTFPLRQAEAWRRITAAASGQVLLRSGLWTFDSIAPPASGATWKVVSHVPAGELDALTRPALTGAVASVLVLWLLCGLSSGLVARAWARRDRAEHRRMQRKTRESEAGLRLVLQSNPNAMMVVDRHGAIVEANPQAESVFDYPRARLLQLTVEDLVPARHRDAHARHRAGYLESAPARPMGQGLELSARRADGTEFPVEISLAPLTLGGEFIVVATVVDVSVRKQAEAQVRALATTLERRVTQRTDELQRAESELRLILESSADGLFGVDADGRISFANPAACRMLGIAAARLCGREAASLGECRADGNGFARHLEATLHDGVSTTADGENFRRDDGATIPVTYSTHPMMRGIRIVGAVVSFLDATERRALDRAREAALHEAERLAQARSDFLANMSHEIRTPLNGVLGLAQVGFRDADVDAPSRETFGRILDAARTLLGVVDNVLDFSRIEAGKVQVEAVATDVRALVDQALNPILPVAQAKGVRLLVEVEPDAPAHCVTDPTRIRQVLLNLLANAVKFTERGTVTLRVAGRSDLLRFVVVDTGIGIDEEQFARVFSAFEQADTSTTRRFGGTGLGLAICKRIVDLMGGTISVASRLGEGSEFTVEVPCGIAPAVAATAGAHDDVNGSGTRRGARLTGLRILLAEDNEVNQLVVQAMLRHEGPEIVTVGDGRLAVEQVRRAGAGAFDLVLMDIQMPVMDGYEATRLVHEIDPDVPVIGQTAHVLNEAIEQCREAGMVAHLSKPIDRHELIGAILRHARVSAEA